MLDVETGAEKARADTRCGVSTGIWYTPGFGRSGSIARLVVV